MTKLIKLNFDGFYLEENKTLYCSHNAGFFSNCSVTLWSLIDLFNQGIIPETINYSNSFNLYKTQEQIEKEIDVYPYYFKTNATQVLTKESLKGYIKLLRQNHHGIYQDYSFDVYNLFIRKYFNLSDSILNTQKILTEKYNIDFSKTIAVFYRGTDKSGEVKIANPNLYLNKVEEIIKKNPDFRILIQTDQQSFRDLFISNFKNRCFLFEEMPVTDSSIGIHLLQGEENLNMNRFEYGKMVLAVTHLISKCNLIVNHTGNMASWVCLFRGNVDGVFQFDSEGNLTTRWTPRRFVKKIGRSILRLPNPG